MVRARKLGVITPVPYHVEIQAASIYMEFVEGRSVKEVRLHRTACGPQILPRPTATWQWLTLLLTECKVFDFKYFVECVTSSKTHLCKCCWQTSSAWQWFAGPSPAWFTYSSHRLEFYASGGVCFSLSQCRVCCGVTGLGMLAWRHKCRPGIQHGTVNHGCDI